MPRPKHERPAAATQRTFAAALLERHPDAHVATLLRGRLLAATAAVVSTAAVLGWYGEQQGYYGSGTTSLAVTAAVLFAITFLIEHVARLLDRSEGTRRRLEADYRQLVEQLPLVVYVDELSDNSANIYTSPQVESLLGYTVDEWVRDPDLFIKTLHPDDRERVLADVRRTNVEHVPFVCEYRLVARDGRVVWIHDESSIFRDEAGTPMHSQGYMIDITRRRLAEEKLRRLATTDPLTSLPNRTQLLERLQAATRVGDTQALLFLDVDDFKTVNDSLGHRAGDALLVALGARLNDCVRGDDLVVRVGGDEFAVLTDQVDDTALAGLARRLLNGLSDPFVVDGRELWASASIGIATGGTEDEMLRNADLAMYEAKARGGNSFAFYAAELHEAAERRLGLLADLRRPELFDEFHLVYQPTFDLRRGHVEGLEALLRWEHPTLGLVSPAEFIPVAEDSGAIVEIGRWVLRTACREAARWPNRSGSFTLAVNVSGRQLREPGFMDDVRAALVESGLEPKALRLELTESVLVHASESARENVAAAMGLGIQLAIDDFGTGHSWIGHLQEFAPDIVKIDRSFLAELESGDSPILRGTLALARELGVRVVAEGIERTEQLHAVRRLGCEIGQGFLLSVPLSAGDAAALIERGPIAAVAGLRLV